jgi:hypothetical protein
MKLSLYKKVQEKKSYKIERIGELPAKRKNNFREGNFLIYFPCSVVF